MSYSQNTILEHVTQCNYPINVKDYIANMISEITTTDKTCKYFKINKSKSDNSTEIILALRLMIPTLYSGLKYEIPIIIYLPKTFPFSPPEIFIEKFSKDIEINPNNKCVDPNTGKIITKGIQTWNSYSFLPSIIKEINFSFNQVFPVYQAKKDVGSEKSSESISSTSPGSSIKTTPIYPEQNIEGINAAIKKELIQEILNRVFNPIKQEMSNLQKESNTCQYFKHESNQQNKKISEFISNKDSLLNSLRYLIGNLTKEYDYLKCCIDKLNEQILSQENCLNYIKVSENIVEHKILNLTAFEATLEDIINVIKKSYERQITDFPNTMKFIRLISREIIKIRFLKDKEIMKIQK